MFRPASRQKKMETTAGRTTGALRNGQTSADRRENPRHKGEEEDVYMYLIGSIMYIWGKDFLTLFFLFLESGQEFFWYLWNLRARFHPRFRQVRETLAGCNRDWTSQEEEVNVPIFWQLYNSCLAGESLSILIPARWRTGCASKTREMWIGESVAWVSFCSRQWDLWW